MLLATMIGNFQDGSIPGKLQFGSGWWFLDQKDFPLIITVLSNIGGWLPGWLMRRGWSVTRARKTSMFIFALCVVPILFATSVDNWFISYLRLCLYCGVRA